MQCQCIDYRLLNNKTVTDRHPLPRIQDLTDSLEGYSWFSILDQCKAYHQGFIAEGSRYLTAFTAPWGLYESARIPRFGRNAASPTLMMCSVSQGSLMSTYKCYAEFLKPYSSTG